MPPERRGGVGRLVRRRGARHFPSSEVPAGGAAPRHHPATGAARDASHAVSSGRSPVTRPVVTPTSTEATGDARLDDVRVLARVLDSAVRVPGTNLRVGLDAALGLLPGVGDIAGGVFASYVLVQAARLGAPPSVLMRMLVNVGIDSLVGTVPLLGDFFDIGWKSSTRNVALLERHLERPGETRAASRRVVGAVLVALALLVAGGVVLAVLVMRALLQLLT